MAEIDKALPNIKPEDQILLEQGVEQELPDVAPPRSYSDMPVEKYLRRREYMDLANGGLTKTVPPAKGPDSQGVESLFRRRYS